VGLSASLTLTVHTAADAIISPASNIHFCANCHHYRHNTGQRFTTHRWRHHPTTSSELYTGGISFGDRDDQCIAVASNYYSSAVASATYTINLPADFSVPSTLPPLTIATEIAHLTRSPSLRSTIYGTVSFSLFGTANRGNLQLLSEYRNGKWPNTDYSHATAPNTALWVVMVFPCCRFSASDDALLFGISKRRNLQRILLVVVSVAV